MNVQNFQHTLSRIWGKYTVISDVSKCVNSFAILAIFDYWLAASALHECRQYILSFNNSYFVIFYLEIDWNLMIKFSEYTNF